MRPSYVAQSEVFARSTFWLRALFGEGLARVSKLSAVWMRVLLFIVE